MKGTMKGGRKLSKWNLFVKKIYWEGKSKNKNYEFKNALIDAQSRKSEMTQSTFGLKNKSKKHKKANKRGDISLATTRGRRRN